MAEDIIKSFQIAFGWKVDTASEAVAKKSVADYEQAVVRAEKAIEDARWAGAKTDEEVARLTRETNLRLAKEALQRAKDEEKQRQEADKKQEIALKAARARIADFAKVAIGLGAAIEAAALGVHAGVVKMAQGFDTLNFTSQRTGATVRNIQAIGYAASQMGSTVEAGVGSLESFARTLRQSPGSYSLLERLGIKTTDAKGVRRSADELFQEFGKALREKPGYLQDQYLQDFGIDEKTGRALIQGLDKFTEEYNEKLRKTGLDPDKAAKDSAALQRTFGSLAASISIIGQKVASGLFSGENNAFQKFIEFLDQHGDEIASVITHVAQVVLELAKALLELVTSPEAKKWFDTLMLAFGDFDKETGKFTANTDKMKAALGIFGTFVATTWLSKILGAFGLLGAGWSGLLRTVGIPVAIGAIATDHGYQTPEGAAGDPDQAQLQREGIERRGRVRGAISDAWEATKKFGRHLFGGGEADAAEGGAGIRARTARALRGDQSGGVAANPGAYKDVLDHIARSEGTAKQPGGGYNTSLKYGAYLPGGKEQNLTGKTLDEIDALQTAMLRNPKNSYNSSAIGRYQIVRTTLRDQRQKLGLKGTDLFDEKMQDRIGANLARQRGADPVGLQQEWASLVGAKNATAVALMQKVDPKASTMPLDRPQAPVASTAQPASAGNPDGSPAPTDGTGVNNDLMRVVKRAQELSDVKFHVHEGLRTLERQAEMVRRGWSKTMNSKHLTGRAVDIRADGDPAVGALDEVKYAKINDAMKKAAKELDVPVQWGGDSFGKFKDMPHFQLPDAYKSNAGPYPGDPKAAQAPQAANAPRQDRPIIVPPKVVSMRDVFPSGPPTFNRGSLPSLISPTLPAPNMDNSKSINVTINQGDTNVHGMGADDSRRVGNAVGAVAGYRNSDLVRNLRSSLA